jgi:hypothetical protein
MDDETATATIGGTEMTEAEEEKMIYEIGTGMDGTVTTTTMISVDIGIETRKADAEIGTSEIKVSVHAAWYHFEILPQRLYLNLGSVLASVYCILSLQDTSCAPAH